MAAVHLLRNRKRIIGLRRAPDGSAFQKCDSCGVSVAIALYDMHDCKHQQKIKRFRGVNRKAKLEFDSSQESEVLNHNTQQDQPRSAFCLFMESFREDHKNEDHFDVDQRGFHTWKNMSTKEREKFVTRAERVNRAYEKALLREVDATKVDDEAHSLRQVDDEEDSEMVGKVDAHCHNDHCYDSDYFGSSHILWHY